MIAIIYHKNCRDGYGAASVACYYYEYKQLLQCPSQIQYFRADPSKMDESLAPIMELSPETKILSFDVSFTPPHYNLLKSKFQDVVIVDHHKTTVESFQQLPTDIIFDNSKSGCVLAWNYFFSEQPVPPFLLYLQDRDLWTFNMPDSDIVNEGLYRLVPIKFEDETKGPAKEDFSQWLEILDGTPDFWKNILEESLTIGNIFIKQKEIDLNFMKRNARKMEFVDKNQTSYKVMVCNTTNLISDLGNLLVKENLDTAFAFLYRIVGDEVWVSLRSLDQFDVTTVATQYGGGGHKNASGFMCKFNNLQLTKATITIKA